MFKGRTNLLMLRGLLRLFAPPHHCYKRKEDFSRRRWNSTSPRQASRIIRFRDHQGNIHFGEPVDGDAKFSRAYILKENNPYGDLKVDTSVIHEVAELLAPIEPTQIIGIGLNYRGHAAETGFSIPKHPVMFMKTLNTVQHPNQPIVIPRIASYPAEIDYEGELAILIGKTCKNVGVETAFEYISGYTIANDVSARRWQGVRGGNQWVRAKSFDTFCPLGPCLVTPNNIVNPQNLRLTTFLNDEIMQDSNTSDMIFSVAEIISQLSQDLTLYQGTIILSGTPKGVGFTRQPPVYLKAGDIARIEIDGIGSLTNTVNNCTI